jgi:hypothetical protein
MMHGILDIKLTDVMSIRTTSRLKMYREIIASFFVKILYNTRKTILRKNAEFSNVKRVKTFELPVGFEGHNKFNNSSKTKHRNAINVKSMKLVFFLCLTKFIGRRVCTAMSKEFKQHVTTCTYIKLDFELYSGCRRSHLTLGITSDTFGAGIKSPVCA